MEESEGVSLPLFHEHLMVPWNDLRRGDCCRRLEDISDGYYCKRCDFFIHKTCSESSETIQHPSHPGHTLRLQNRSESHRCDLCGKHMRNVYRCEICEFVIDLACARNPPPQIIESSETHSHHKLTLFKNIYPYRFDCAATNCGKKIGCEFPYKCHECDFTFFHVDCVWQPLELNRPLEINHSYHSLHPLKLLRGKPPDYCDGRCRLCGRFVNDELFYHCSACNFTLDMGCVLHPPQQSLLDLKVHDHQLTLLPRLDSFTCNACGLKGDRSPYVCFHCGFMIHQDCLELPRVININRHKHRISRTSVLGVVNSVCGVCRQKVDWKYGGYSCQKCLGYVVHSQCAAAACGDVWIGKELEGVVEETEDVEPYVVIDDNTIQHFSHKEHYLRLNINGLQWEENKHCNGCTQPIGHQSFYGCIDCDFILHQNCAELPRKKWHVLHDEQLTLVTSKADWFRCYACKRMSNGFAYVHGDTKFDLRCGSISEPFVHPRHPHHPLYCIPRIDHPVCIRCDIYDVQVLRCIEDDCGFGLDFKCATIPQMVKHSVDNHPLSLCYGEKDASGGKYCCNICEEEIDPKKWFYTSKDHRASFHTKCVLGKFIGLMPRSKIEHRNRSYEVVLNNGISRPFCRTCKSRCSPTIILKLLGSSDAYFCSFRCIDHFRIR